MREGADEHPCGVGGGRRPVPLVRNTLQEHTAAFFSLFEDDEDSGCDEEAISWPARVDDGVILAAVPDTVERSLGQSSTVAGRRDEVSHFLFDSVDCDTTSDAGLCDEEAISWPVHSDAGHGTGP